MCVLALYGMSLLLLAVCGTSFCFSFCFYVCWKGRHSICMCFLASPIPLLSPSPPSVPFSPSPFLRCPFLYSVASLLWTDRHFSHHLIYPSLRAHGLGLRVQCVAGETRRDGPSCSMQHAAAFVSHTLPTYLWLSSPALSCALARIYCDMAWHFV